MKYIPADKLIAEIERRIEAYRQKVAEYEKKGDNISASIEGIEAASLISFRSFITSLQQEQPADEDDGKFVKILVRKEFAERFQKLGEEIQAGQSSFIMAMKEQEHPEVELDKLVNEEFASRSQITEHGLEVIYNRAELSRFIKRMVLVFNARKEVQP